MSRPRSTRYSMGTAVPFSSSKVGGSINLTIHLHVVLKP